MLRHLCPIFTLFVVFCSVMSHFTGNISGDISALVTLPLVASHSYTPCSLRNEMKPSLLLHITTSNEYIGAFDNIDRTQI